MFNARKVDPALSGGLGMSRGERKDAIRAVLFEHVHSLTRREIADAMSLGKSPYLSQILAEMCHEGYVLSEEAPTPHGSTRFYWLSPMGVDFMTARAVAKAEGE